MNHTKIQREIGNMSKVYIMRNKNKRMCVREHEYLDAKVGIEINASTSKSPIIIDVRVFETSLR